MDREAREFLFVLLAAVVAALLSETYAVAYLIKVGGSTDISSVPMTMATIANGVAAVIGFTLAYGPLRRALYNPWTGVIWLVIVSILFLCTSMKTLLSLMLVAVFIGVALQFMLPTVLIYILAFLVAHHLAARLSCPSR